MRFRLTWAKGRYTVSEPGISTCEVVTADEHDTIRAERDVSFELNDRWNRAVSDFAAGSEFIDDPERVHEYLKQRWRLEIDLREEIRANHAVEVAALRAERDAAVALAGDNASAACRLAAALERVNADLEAIHDNKLAPSDDATANAIVAASMRVDDALASTGPCPHEAQLCAAREALEQIRIHCREQYIHTTSGTRPIAEVVDAALASVPPCQHAREVERLQWIADEIREIVHDYRDGECSTPGGLEHMGDVWRLLIKWNAMLAAAKGETA